MLAAKLAPSFAVLDIDAPASDVLAAITAAATESVLAFLRTVLSDLAEATSAPGV